MVLILNNRIIYQVCCFISSEEEKIHFFNIVHGTGGIDASSSPSPQSTYSPQSSPSESRTSPNVASKQQSSSNLNHKFSMNSNSGTSLTSASSHVTSHHNDLTGGGSGATNRLNGRLKLLVIFFYLKEQNF
jgi:hypothetical protein